ncbi:MAG: hypothetical protein K6F68_07530 [Clostridiales bacterium]|nr:hypothetical protein [Clostridiales bacterium]
MNAKRLFTALLAALMLFAAGCVKDPVNVNTDPTAVPTTAPTEAPKVEVKDMLAAAPAVREYVKHPNSLYPNVDYNDREAWKAYWDQEDLWYQALAARREEGKKVTSLSVFTGLMTTELVRENPNKNVVWSPMNVYIALAMLAETTAGETRKQILTLLGSSDMEAIRANVIALMNAESNDDGVSASLLANSLWLNRRWSFYEDTLKLLANSYSASSYWGDPGDPAFTLALRQWLNDNTGGLLKDAVDNVRLDADTVLAIASTLYFKAAWENEFNKERTSTETFHAPSGDIKTDFMHGTIGSMESLYYQGESFTAVRQGLKSEANSVWYLLPNEGVSIAEMLEKEGLAFINSDKSMAEDGYIVNITVPKLDVSSEFELKKTLMALGMTDCFDYTTADFTPLSPDPDMLYVSSVTHAARVKTDEEGVEAAAFTVIDVKCGAAPVEHPIVEFVLDRPFVMVITGASGQPMFIVVVNTPVE